MDFSRVGPARAVTQLVDVDLVDATGAAVPGEAELRYEPADPYAVTATFQTGRTEVSWTFGRDLLIEGAFRPSGEGDVHVQPCLDPDGHAVVLLEFHSGGSVGLVQVRARDVHSFVERMIAAVRPGKESQWLDIDASLAALLVPESGN